MGKTIISLVLALALVTLRVSSQTQCNLSGSWKNELGSTMNISAVKNEEFSGTYLTAVSARCTRIRVSSLTGLQHTKSPIFVFTVDWVFADSMTIFVGQCFVDDDGEETLRTMWLLRETVNTIGDDWQATMVGSNVFTRLSEGLGETP